MQHLIRLSDWNPDDIYNIFSLADELAEGKYVNSFAGKSVVLFFPPTSLLTRTAFERSVSLLGGQTVLFPNEVLDGKGFRGDTVGYLANWADAIVARHRDITILEQMAEYSSIPIINAMTNINHPCEILSDMYALSKLRPDFEGLNYLFVGAAGNIGNAWQEAVQVIGLNLVQCCPIGYDLDGVRVERDIEKAVSEADVVLTDSLPAEAVAAFAPYQITAELMNSAKCGALLNPCPMFFRGQEVSADAIDSKFFVGYEFKKRLVEIQQAILLYCTGSYSI